MKSDSRLNRDRITDIIKKTASYKPLTIAKADANRYRLQAASGFSNLPGTIIRPSGVYQPTRPVSVQQYFFGSGLVNAEAAVEAVKQGR